jgi:RNA polymerase sigma-70 factor (ECF subfamily)
MAATQADGSVLLQAHDVELAALSAAGDRRAFSELVRRHGSGVRVLLRRMGAAPALADAVAQEAFLAAYERIGDFRSEAPFQAWVRQIAARALVRRFLRGGGQFQDAGPAVKDAASAGETKSGDWDLDQALEGLSTLERICVGLCYGGGLPQSEAAEALKLPLGTLKSHLGRGLDELRRRLSATNEGVNPQSTERRGDG